MSEARDRILASIRSSLNRGRLDATAEGGLRARVAAHRRNLVPARAAALDHRQRVDLFVAMAEEVQATVARVTSLAVVPEAVARYLAAENLPAELVMAPDPASTAIPWRRGRCCGSGAGRAEARRPGQPDAVSCGDRRDRHSDADFRRANPDDAQFPARYPHRAWSAQRPGRREL